MSDFEITISPINENYDDHDPRWIGQKDELVANIKREVGTVRKETVPVPGQKGGIESIIVALGSSGVITAVVDTFRAWLGRDRKRQIAITIERNGKKESIIVDGNGIDKSTLKEIFAAALQSR